MERLFISVLSCGRIVRTESAKFHFDEQIKTAPVMGAVLFFGADNRLSGAGAAIIVVLMLTDAQLIADLFPA